MNIPNEATEAAVRALFEDGCGEPKVDASTALEAAYKFIAAQVLRDAVHSTWNLEDGSVIDIYRCDIAEWLESRANEVGRS